MTKVKRQLNDQIEDKIYDIELCFDRYIPDALDIVPDLANNGIPPLLPLSLDEDVEVYRNLRILKVLFTPLNENQFGRFYGEMPNYSPYKL